MQWRICFGGGMGHQGRFDLFSFFVQSSWIKMEKEEKD